MVKFGYLSWVKLRRTKDDMEIMLYDLAERGIALLREHELPSRNPAGEYFLSNDVFRYMRAKIVSNQLVLHFLGSLKGLRTFYFNRGLRLKGGNAPDQTYLAPLYVQTDAGNYIFDMVGNTTGGKKKFQERMERMLALQEYFPDRTYLAIVAETYEHMEFMTSLMLAYEKRGFGIDILYTHDSEWFYDTPGGFYAMARAMGQSGLMRVKIL